MRLNRLNYPISILIIGLLQSCDTKSNIDAPGNAYFVKYFGNEGSQTGTDLVVNPDGSMILLGTQQRPNANATLYVVKSDADGHVLWEKTFGGPLQCEARDIELTTSGNLIIAGNITQGPGDRDIFVVKLDQNGNKLGDSLIVGYKRVVSPGLGAAGDEDVASITEVDDGGYIIAGSTDNLTNSNAAVVRQALFTRLTVDLVEWDVADWGVAGGPIYGSVPYSYFTKVIQTGGVFYALGSATIDANGTGPTSDFNFWTVTLGVSGTPSDNKGFGLAGVDEKMTSATLLGANLFFLAGITKDSGGNADVCSVKVTSVVTSGVVPNASGFSLGAIRTDHVSGVTTSFAGALLLTNETTEGNNNIYLNELDANGNIAWKSPSIMGGQGDDFAGAVKELPDRSILVIATMAIGQVNGETKMVLFKLNKDGQFAK